MFLKPRAKPVPRLDALAARRVACPAREPQRIPRQLLRRRRLERRGRTDHLGDRQRAVDLLAGREHVARLQRVQEPELDRIDVERRRELVHLRLGGEAGLHRAEPAHRAARRVVRVHGRRLDQRVRDLVGPAGERCGVRADGGRRGGVGAAVEQDAEADVHELALARRAVLDPHARRVPVDVAGERLLAVVDDLDRPARVQREQGAVDLHRQILATAERAADTGEMDPHLVERKVEARRDLHGGRRAATGSRRRCRRRLPRRGPRARTRGRGTPGPGCRPRSSRSTDDVALGVGITVADHHVADDVRARVVEVAVARGRALVVDGAAAPSPAPCR